MVYYAVHFFSFCSFLEAPFFSHERSYSTYSTFNSVTVTGNRSRMYRLPSWYLTNHPGQLSLAIPPWIGAMSTGNRFPVSAPEESGDFGAIVGPVTRSAGIGLLIKGAGC